MRPIVAVAWSVVLVSITTASVAHADGVRGIVEATTSRWTADGTRIITNATIRKADGSLTLVSQLGGRADGLAMRQFVGGRAQPLLELGQEVEVSVEPGKTTPTGALIARDVSVVVAARDEFVRTGPTQLGNFAYWESGCVLVAYGAQGTSGLPGTTEFDAMDNVISTWNTSIASCSYMNLESTGTSNAEVGRDLINVVIVRDDRWCRPSTSDDAERCYSSSAAGITTVTYVDDVSSARDGAIVDADIEINNVDFDIAAGGSRCLADFANTLTHEFGHLLGLEHTCLAAGDPDRVDGDGNPVPMCSGTADPDILDATMYNFQTCGETSKRSLSPDDIEAMCRIYPTAQDPESCEAATLSGNSGGCCQTDRGNSPAAPLILIAMVSLGLRRRRAARA